ncbi:MAG: histidinol-phosphatase HisJ family protein [Eubacterium sp.]|nr:histidinol-phosphatase HisJ family protein [Eubacterium sp.]
MKIQYDTHLHSEFSMDSQTPISEQIDQAIKLGLSGLCFTDHNDFGFPLDQCPGHDTNPFILDVDKYISTIKKEQRNNRNLDIAIGVECGLQTDVDVIEANKKLCDNPAFDQVIGSIHLIDKKDPYEKDCWKNADPHTLIKRYFTSTLQNIMIFSNFNILGHLDYAVRYKPADFQYDPKNYMEITDEIMKVIIKKDIALEVNTAGIYRAKKMGDRIPNPHPSFIQRYFELGGKLISIGSDAHTSDVLAADFTYVADLLTDIGFTEYVTYKRRLPILHPLT